MSPHRGALVDCPLPSHRRPLGHPAQHYSGEAQYELCRARARAGNGGAGSSASAVPTKEDFRKREARRAQEHGLRAPVSAREGAQREAPVTRSPGAGGGGSERGCVIALLAGLAILLAVLLLAYAAWR